MTSAETAGGRRLSLASRRHEWLSARATPLALLFVTLSSTVFQFVTIATAAAIGGTVGVGRYSIVLTAVTACSFLLGSDYRSLTLSQIIEKRDLTVLKRFRLASGIALLTIWCIVTYVERNFLWLIVGLFRLLTSLYDGEFAKSQIRKDSRRIFLISGFLYGLGSIWFMVGPKLGISFEWIFLAYITASFTPLVFLREPLQGDAPFPSPVREFSSIYFALGAAGFLGLAPQFLVRWFLGRTGDLSLVGNFSLDYQLALCGIPLVTAFSQNFMARPVLDRTAIRVGALQVVCIATLIALPTASTTIPVVRGFVSFIFHGYVGLGVLDKLMLVASAILTYIVVFLGFISVRTPARSAQLGANIIFISALVAGCAVLGHLAGPSGVIAAMLIATFARACWLASAVFRAVPSRPHDSNEPNS